jgi:hypothetical protein
MKQMMAAQIRLTETLTAHLASLGSSAPTHDLPSVDHVARNIPDSLYDPQSGVSFEACFKRYEDVFSFKLADGDEKTKIQLILRKLGPAEHVRYTNYILPEEPRSRSFVNTVGTVKIFGIHHHCSIPGFR